MFLFHHHEIKNKDYETKASLLTLFALGKRKRPEFCCVVTYGESTLPPCLNACRNGK